MMLLLNLCLSAIVSVTYSELVCDAPNQQLSHYTSVCPETCQTLGKVHCLGLLKKDSCICINGTVLDSGTGVCVLPKDCPQSPQQTYADLVCDAPNQVLSHTTPVCPITCQSVGKVHCLGIIVMESCQCTNGTVLDTVSGQCVRDCPRAPEPLQSKDELLCAQPNEHYSETTPCHTMTCANRKQPVQMNCLVIIDKPSCQCNPGTIRDTVNNRCVTSDQCP